MGVSYHQAKRISQRYQASGDGGLVHGLRGKRPNRSGDQSLKKRALVRYKKMYGDYGPTLAAECLAQDGFAAPVSTLRRWLMQAGLWTRQRRSRQHRRRRARREHVGELVQMDGSHHDWFEGRRAEAVMIDDATSRIVASFFEEETLAAAFEMMQRYILREGLPRALYVDRAGIYRSDGEPTADEVLAGKEPQTQLGRVKLRSYETAALRGDFSSLFYLFPRIAATACPPRQASRL